VVLCFGWGVGVEDVAKNRFSLSDPVSLGVIPLLIATGAGSESQKVIGTAVFGGVIAATFLSLAVVPMLYYVVQTLVERGGKKA